MSIGQNYQIVCNFGLKSIIFLTLCNSFTYRELADFVFCFLSLPLSNADVERLFSQMNVVKTKKRNKMKLPLLDGILRIKFGLRNQKKRLFQLRVSRECPAENLKSRKV